MRTRSGRVWAVVVCGVLALPMLGIPSRDSFPLSSYPMFSRERPRIVTVAHVLGERADGSSSVLGPRWLGTNEVLTARAVIAAAAVDADDAAALCDDVLARSDGRDVVAVAIRVDTYDSVAYFAGRDDPIDGVEVARCGG